MRVLLLGANGQVGWELRRALAPLGELTALGRQGDGERVGDLSDLAGIAQTVQALTPDIIVNAAAYTAVDKAESEPDVARLINAEAVRVLATQAARQGALLVHYSTDYVFDGTGADPWAEDAPTAPVNVYGATKLEGEQAIRDSGCRHLIFRTSWVYAARGANFLRTMLRLATERESLRVVDDQVGAPAGAELIADVTAHALRAAQRHPALDGTYHLAPRGETSWCSYARLVIATARRLGVDTRCPPENIDPIPTEAFPTPAPRPRNSRLDVSRLQSAFGLRMPPWEEGVERTVEEWVVESSE